MSLVACPTGTCTAIAPMHDLPSPAFCICMHIAAPLAALPTHLRAARLLPCQLVGLSCHAQPFACVVVRGLTHSVFVASRAQYHGPCSGHRRRFGPPSAALFHLLFKTLAIRLHVWHVVLEQLVNMFIVCVLLLAFDFWTVKNVTGLDGRPAVE